MQLFQLFFVAFTALRLNLLRSFLTMLGVIIGVAAVIIMVALGAGAQQEIDRQLDSLGGNIFIVSNSRRNASGAAKKAGSVQRLDLDDAAYLQAQVPGIDRVAPILRSEGQVIYGNVNWRTRVDGIDSGAFIARNLQLDEGRVFSAQELRSATKVVILGETVRAELFGEGRALGQVVRINNFNAKVIGTLLPKGQSQYGDDLDDVMFMPLEAVRKRIQGVSKSQPKSVSWLVVKMLDGYDMTFAEDDIKEALRVNMKVLADQTDTFRVRNLSQILTAGAETEQVFNRLLASVASVSLLVGGIGIMNIMLVSVTERTREIGLRMALGATPVDILRQFLIEAITLCGLGGAMGISIAMLATTIAALLTAFIRFATERYWVSLKIPMRLGLSIFVCAISGLLIHQALGQAQEHEALKTSQSAKSFPEQVEQLELAMKREPNNPKTAASLGEIYRRHAMESRFTDKRANLDKAISWLMKATRLNPYDAYSHARFGMALDQLDRAEEAEAMFNKAEELDPNGYMTVAYIAWHKMHIKDYAAAKRYFERVSPLDDPATPEDESEKGLVAWRSESAATNLANQIRAVYLPYINEQLADRE